MFTKEKIIFYSDKFLYWLVILIPFAGSISSAMVNIFIGFATAAYILKKSLSKDHLPQGTAISVPFIFLMLVSLISMRNSLEMGSSIQGMLKLLKFGFTFLIIADSVVDLRHAQRIALSLTCGLFVSCVDAVYQLQFGKDFIRGNAYNFVIGIPRLKAAFPHTNLFGLYLGLTLPAVFCLGRYFLEGRKKLFFTVTSILAIFCIIFTFSRGAVIGLLIALIFVGLLKKDKVLLTFILVFMLIGPFLMPGPVKDWVKNRSSVLEMLLNAERIYIYKTALNMICHHPFIGVGVNTFCGQYSNYKVNQEYGNTGTSRYYGHNNFLHMAGEIGLIGLGVFLWLLFMLFRKWYIIYKPLPDGSFLKIFGLGLIAGVVAFLVNGMTETGLYYSKIATLFWIQIGILLAVFKVSQNTIKER